METGNPANAWGFGRLRLLPALIVPLIGACGGNNVYVEMTKPPLPPFPFVRAEQNEFTLDFKVVNAKSSAVEAQAITVQVRSQYSTERNSTCNRPSQLTNLRLEADGGTWVVDDHRFSLSSLGMSDPCYCARSNACQGVVFVKLTDTASGAMLPGPQSHVQIAFGGSGTLDDVSISDQSN